MAKQQIEESKEKLTKGKPIRILKSNLVEKQLNTKYSKWQLKLSKWIGVTPADNYQYLFKASYKGSVNVKNNDILYNSENLPFICIKASLGLMMLVSVNAYNTKPLMRGTLTVFQEKDIKNL